MRSMRATLFSLKRLWLKYFSPSSLIFTITCLKIKTVRCTKKFLQLSLNFASMLLPFSLRDVLLTWCPHTAHLSSCSHLPIPAQSSVLPRPLSPIFIPQFSIPLCLLDLIQLPISSILKYRNTSYRKTRRNFLPSISQK